MTKELILDILDRRGPMALDSISKELYRLEYVNPNEAALHTRNHVHKLVEEGKVTGVDTGTYDISPSYNHGEE